MRLFSRVINELWSIGSAQEANRLTSIILPLVIAVLDSPKNYKEGKEKGTDFLNNINDR